MNNFSQFSNHPPMPEKSAPRHLYDLLTSKVVDPAKEYYRLKQLFFEDKIPVSRYPYSCSFKELIGQVFRILPIRGTAPDIDNFLSDALPKYNWQTFSLEDLIIYCEVLENILRQLAPKTVQVMVPQAQTIYNQILENIRIIFEKAGYKFIDREGILYAIRKDTAVDEAVEQIANDQVALDVLEYNRVSLKGNLARKKEILASFGLYAEQIFKSPKFADQFKQLRSDVGFCLNNLNIRHNQAANKVSQRVLQGMTEEELELWYDRTYTLLVSVVLMNTTRDIQTQLEPLKQKAGNPNG